MCIGACLHACVHVVMYVSLTVHVVYACGINELARVFVLVLM